MAHDFSAHTTRARQTAHQSHHDATACLHLPNRRKATPTFININFAKIQALPGVQACHLFKNGKFSCAPWNRHQPLMTRGSSIWCRGQMDFGFW